MKKYRELEKDGLIVTHFGGIHTFNHAEEALDELLELKAESESIYEIVINDDDLQLDFNKQEQQALIGKVESIYNEFNQGALAVVANNDFVFGLSRMLELSIQNERIAISVFRSEELARKWIQEIRDLHDLDKIKTNA